MTSGPIPCDLIRALRRRVACETIEGASASLGIPIRVIEKMFEYQIATADRIRSTRKALAKVNASAVISDAEIARRVRAGELQKMVMG